MPRAPKKTGKFTLAKTGRVELAGPWTLSFTPPHATKPVHMPGTVPGNVEIDLLREGLIADPYPPDDVSAQRDYELVDDWSYSTEFDAPALQPGEKIRLVFAGIDTIADVHLNGKPLLHCENMFIPHCADVTGQLKKTGNRLTARIFSPELFARKYAYDAFQISRHSRQSQAYLRKARHAWGWDNAPRLLSAGLWRPVYLEVLAPIRFTEVYAYTQKVEKDRVWLGVNWNLETPDADLTKYRGRLTLSRHGRVEHELAFPIDFVSDRFAFSLPRDQVELWWPRGYGQPALYELKLELCIEQQVAAEWNSRFGIREIELWRTSTISETGDGEFVFKCNGERVYICGTNWKPLDVLHSRAKTKIRRALELCLELNCNMVRVWGGGVYEDHDFFDFCDAHGLLVWQDFMFACELPPQGEVFKSAVAQESAVIVKRLRNHASVAVWCGDNEIDATFLWGRLIPAQILPSDNEISRKVLRQAVLTHDPYRPYVESSPFIADQIVSERRLSGETKLTPPESHLYPPNENYREEYRRNRSPFIGETGPMFINAMAETPAIIQRELPRAERLWHAPLQAGYTLDRHQTDDYFLTWKDAVQKRLRHYFGREFNLTELDELTLGVNVVCAEMFKFAIEYSRAIKWRKTGVLWWSLADMWPQGFNYSVVDYEFRPKLPYWWIRQSQQPKCLLAIEIEAGQAPTVFAVNDTLAPWRGAFTVRGVDAEGQERVLLNADFAVAANASTKVNVLSDLKTQELCLLEWATEGERGTNHYVHGAAPFDFSAYWKWCGRLDNIYRCNDIGRELGSANTQNL